MVEWMISSSVLIVLVMAMRYFFRRRLPMRAWYALWLVVALRLLVPVSFMESGLSVLNLFALQESGEGQGTGDWPEERQDRTDMAAKQPEGQNGSEPEAERQQNRTEQEVIAGLPGQKGPEMATGLQNPSGMSEGQTGPDMEALNGSADSDPIGASAATADGTGSLAGESKGSKSDVGKPSASVSGRLQEPESPIPPSAADAGIQGKEREHSLFWYIWLLGAAFFACCILMMNGRYRRRVRISRKRCQTGISSRLPVYISPVVESPCMFGLARPAVYLSREAARKPEALRYVLCHENVHYSHRDNLWVVVRMACLCLHWYNPLVWAAAALSEQDGELACDERTLEILGQQDRIPYGRALLDFSAQGSPWQRGWKLSTAMSSGKKLLKERLMVIVGEPRRHAEALAGVMLLTALCMAVTFTGRVSGQETEEDAAREEMKDTAPGDAAFVRTGSGKAGALAADGAESTAIVPVSLGEGKEEMPGEEHLLKIIGRAVPGSGQYRIDQIALNRVQGRREEPLQTIRPEDVRVLYTRALEDIRGGVGQMYSFTSEEEPLYAKPLCRAEDLPARELGKFLADENGQIYADALDGGLVVTDLNFDGYEDFYLQGGTGTVNIPYYCYLWNPQGERFEPGYMIPNVEVDSEAQLIKSATDDGNGQHSVKYYRFDEANILHMVRYVEENQSPDAVFPTLDLTYCEPYYALPAVDEWDYGTRYGGALTERFVYWAKEALTELYEWSGTKIDKACFTVTRFGDFCFANTPEELQSSLIYYDRVYGEDAGFESCVKQMGVATERTVWFSPVIQWNKPENPDGMTDHELAEWYFERAPLAEGEKLVSVEGIGEGIGYDTYSILNILAESGNFYQIYLNGATREMSAMYGPYEERPD